MNDPKQLLSLVLVLCLMPIEVMANETYTVVQSGRRFQPNDLAISAGDTLRFENHDEFIHQVFVDSPAMHFDSAEKAPGESLDLPFTEQGTFEVQCHIHPKMKLIVHVK